MRLAPILCIALLPAGCARELVVHGQDEAGVNRVLQLLLCEDLDADKVPDDAQHEARYAVSVPKAERRRALEILAQHGLPETPRADTCKVYSGTSIIPSAEQERARRECALAGDIESKLKIIPRVTQVAAIASLAPPDPLRELNQPESKPKASVTVIYLPDAAANPPLSVEDVQRQVQAIHPDLVAREVAVKMIPYVAGCARAMGVIAGGGCEKVALLGMELCGEDRTRVQNLLIASALGAAVLAMMSLGAMLRALRYRRDLTRLTAELGK
jgi:type III secretory pathway lipoprotein EscJ